MFMWQGEKVASFEKLVGSVGKLKSADDGSKLYDLCVLEFGEADARFILGFMLGFINSAAERSKMSGWLGGVKHPTMPECTDKVMPFDDSFKVGLAQAKMWVAKPGRTDQFVFSTEDKTPETPESALAKRAVVADWNF